MIIGHAPVGYISGKLLLPLFEWSSVGPKAFIWAGIAGAVAPDLDMLYFHLLDAQRHHHHTYWTHFPLVWVSLLLAALAWFGAGRSKKLAALAVVFSLNGFLHMALDTIVGDIWWLAPFVDRPFALFTVPALYKPWWLNFVFHWSFALELVAVLWAVLLWRKPRAKPNGV